MGFTKEILQAGNGQKPTVGQTVTVHCTGYGKHRDLAQKFWSTKDPGQEVCAAAGKQCFFEKLCHEFRISHLLWS